MKRAQKRQLAYRVRIAAALVFVAVALGLVWLTGLTSRNIVMAEVRTRSEATLAVQSAVLERLLDKFRLMSPLLARGPEAAAVVTGRDLELARQVAALTAGMSGAEEVWFLDANGRPIASSLENGQSIAKRGATAIPQAFRQAQQGQLGRELLPGTPSRPANYVFASPIRDPNGQIGVLAVRVSLDDIEQAWALTKDPIVALDAAGRVVVTNVPEWRGRLIRDLSPETHLAGPSTSNMLSDLTGLSVPGRTRSHLDLSTRLPVLGWDVLTFADTTEAKRQSGRAMVIAFLLAVIAAGILWIVLNRRRELARKIRHDRLAALRLERRVQTRTAELRKTNMRLEQEVAERLQAEDDLRRAQADLVQAAKMATLGKMSAALSHEYNQPLAAIRSDAEIAEMLIARGTPDKALGNLTRIGNMVARMAEIARTLKGFSRKSGTDVRPVSLRQVIDEALLMVMPEVKRSGVALTTDLEDETLVVAGGRIRLEQVVVNLLANAIDAIKHRENPAISLHVLRDGGFAVLIVRDNGPGIDQEALPQIFEPFFTTKDSGAGLGLGLSIAYKIVHDFAGTLTARNRPERGAEFELRLPLAEGAILAAE
ncbi:ATP-binding protein [Roseibium sp. RKSG952]|uniref:sensor histidine kinase n=1 Tax=Roseibium sp. RKSG952 TaxID=2529384 RepID=UPI0012BBFCBC|nr:ATP-binding protein [Roseibium sp. RKSG952]MTH98869.1 sensor histidine kinase [Roseibium sp. RKSG952]